MGKINPTSYGPRSQVFISLTLRFAQMSTNQSFILRPFYHNPFWERMDVVYKLEQAYMQKCSAWCFYLIIIFSFETVLGRED
jgi:hypothetical protein